MLQGSIFAERLTFVVQGNFLDSTTHRRGISTFLLALHRFLTDFLLQVLLFNLWFLYDLTLKRRIRADLYELLWRFKMDRRLGGRVNRFV